MTQRKELEPLVQKRQVLVRQYDRSEISFDEFSQKYNELDKEYWSKVREFIDKEKDVLKELNRIDDIRRKKMEQEIKEKKKKNFKPRGPKKDSYAGFIIAGLKRKSLNTADMVADWVLEQKPGRDLKKIRSQVVVMVNEIKKGKKPLYTFDEERYLVEEKDPVEE